MKKKVAKIRIEIFMAKEVNLLEYQKGFKDQKVCKDQRGSIIRADEILRM